MIVGFFMNKIETERLLLRLYTSEDKPHSISLLTDADVMKHVDEGVLSLDAAEALWGKLLGLYEQGVDTIWAAFEKESGKFVGHATLRPRPAKPEEWELGYILVKSHWGKGFATEIAIRLLEYGFDTLRFEEVFATVDDDHPASIHVLEKIGMKFNRYEYDAKGRYSIYSIKRADFALSPE